MMVNVSQVDVFGRVLAFPPQAGVALADVSGLAVLPAVELVPPQVFEIFCRMPFAGEAHCLCDAVLDGQAVSGLSRPPDVGLPVFAGHHAEVFENVSMLLGLKSPTYSFVLSEY